MQGMADSVNIILGMADSVDVIRGMAWLILWKLFSARVG